MIEQLNALAFSVFENKGVYALLLGSGLSRAAQIPTGWEITLDLIRRTAALEGVTKESDWAAWYLGKAGKAPNYSDVLDLLASKRDERRRILHTYIEPNADDIREGRKVPTAAHHAIAWLVREGFLRVVITTNFDRLMENALREAGVEPTVVSSDDDLRGAVPLIHGRCYLLKLHGDYLDTRIKNTDQELGAYSKAMNNLLDRILDDHGLIVCGWSGDWDHALRAAITRAPSRRFATFWASRGAPSAQANDLIQKRAGKIITITDADSFFAGLQQKVASQADAMRPNPQSTELLVATTKRYLSNSEARIQLNDFLAEENRLLAERLGLAGFPSNTPVSADEFGRRVIRYEAASEHLARALGIVGRWGGEADDRLAREILADVGFMKLESGLSWWVDLRFYPAVLLVYAYGLGALKAERYATLYKLFVQLVPSQQREGKPLIRRIGTWEGGDPRRWQQLNGLERHKTPLSQHLHDVTAGWTADYTLSPREHAPLFGKFEVLGALTYLSLTTTKEELVEVHAGQVGRNYSWSPVGRTAWDSETRKVVLPDLERPETQAALLKTGFFGGDGEHLNLALESVRRLMSSISVFG